MKPSAKQIAKIHRLVSQGHTRIAISQKMGLSYRDVVNIAQITEDFSTQHNIKQEARQDLYWALSLPFHKRKKAIQSVKCNYCDIIPSWSPPRHRNSKKIK